MALVVAGGFAVNRGNILLPRIGVWAADLELSATVDVTGQVEIEIAAGPTLVGTVVSGELAYGYVCARVVAGAAGLGKETEPKHYVGATVRTVLVDLMRTAGETLSGTIDPALLTLPLAGWTTLRMPVGEALAALVGSGMPAGTAWRFLPDGTLWIGAETWPDSAVEEWREFDRLPREGRLELGLDSPALLPGTVLGDDRIDYVEHWIDSKGARATAWLA
jgi:hypothetical protein